MSCAICHTLTNHTTAQHEQVCMEQLLCVECGLAHGWDDPGARLCRACMASESEYLSEQAQHYTPDEREGGQA